MYIYIYIYMVFLCSIEEILLEIDKEMENDKENQTLKKPKLRTKHRGQTWIKEDEVIFSSV